MCDMFIHAQVKIFLQGEADTGSAPNQATLAHWELLAKNEKSDLKGAVTLMPSEGTAASWLGQRPSQGLPLANVHPPRLQQRCHVLVGCNSSDGQMKGLLQSSLGGGIGWCLSV